MRTFYELQAIRVKSELQTIRVKPMLKICQSDCNP